MTSGLLILPQERVAQLLAAYARAVARRRWQFFAGCAVVLALTLVAAHFGEVDLSYFVNHIQAFTSYFSRILPSLHVASFRHDVAEWYWNLGGWLKLLIDTILIAYLATLAGAVGAFAASFYAAANLSPAAPVRFAVKRLMEFCRTVPDIVFALLFVAAFGLGPLPGVLAIAIHTFGALGKLFTELIENIDMKPVEGVRSTGANFLETVRYAAVPQVLSGFASYALLRFEINVRSGTVIGLVGAGGIGQDLFVAIRKFYYTDVSAILLMIIITVALIDVVTQHVRHRVASHEAG
jgi:phosphonate transport system permease protein